MLLDKIRARRVNKGIRGTLVRGDKSSVEKLQGYNYIFIAFLRAELRMKSFERKVPVEIEYLPIKTWN